MNAKPSAGRHAAECKISGHPQRDEIEGDFINWRSPVATATGHGLKNRASFGKNAHAGLLQLKRARPSR